MTSDVLVCPVLVGRDGPAARLRHLVDEVAGSAAGPQPADGSRRIALVAGEAGLGKSRLVAETVAHARSRGFRVLVGACFPQDRTSPFAPIVDLLRAALTASRLTRPPRWSGRSPASLGRSCRTWCPARGAAGLPVDADLERDRRRLFVALAHCLLEGPPPPSPLSRARERGSQLTSAEFSPSPAHGGGHGAGGGGHPVCLVVEDLHWCDDVSLDFLAFLARGQARPQPPAAADPRDLPRRGRRAGPARLAGPARPRPPRRRDRPGPAHP